MIIKNQATIKFLVTNNYKIVKNSNMVYIKLINPIINFYVSYCGNKIRVNIRNDSGVTIRSIKYYECIKDSLIVDLLINGCIVKTVDLKKGVFLGKLDINEKVILEYPRERNSYHQSLLYYEFIFNNQINKIYIANGF